MRSPRRYHRCLWLRHEGSNSSSFPSPSLTQKCRGRDPACPCSRSLTALYQRNRGRGLLGSLLRNFSRFLPGQIAFSGQISSNSTLKSKKNIYVKNLSAMQIEREFEADGLFHRGLEKDVFLIGLHLEAETSGVRAINAIWFLQLSALLPSSFFLL